MQRTVNDHTNYIISIRAKCEAGRRPPSTGLPATSCDNLDSYTLQIRGGLQGTNRAVTTCRLPLNRGAPSYPKVFVHLGTMPVYKETTHIPLGLRPYGSTSIGHEQTQRNDEPPPQLSSTSTHTSHMNG